MFQDFFFFGVPSISIVLLMSSKKNLALGLWNVQHYTPVSTNIDIAMENGPGLQLVVF